MLEKLSVDIKEAMKAQEKDKLSALRMLKSKLLENKTSKAPKGEMDVVISYHKQLRDSLEAYPQESPAWEKITQEMGFIEAYLPRQLSQDDVVKLIQAILAKHATPPAFGLVMKELTPQIKGQFDGKKASELVRELIP